MFKSLADRDTGHLQLILGILESGASYLLLTPSEMDDIARTARQKPTRGRNTYPASDFLSLSPISFETVDALTKKLKSYTQSTKSSRKKNRATVESRANEEPHDSSQSNKTYVRGERSRRYAFEQQRSAHESLC